MRNVGRHSVGSPRHMGARTPAFRRDGAGFGSDRPRGLWLDSLVEAQFGVQSGGAACIGVVRGRGVARGLGSRSRLVGRDAALETHAGTRVRAGWSRRLAWAIRHGSCTGWQGVVADPEHGPAHGGLGDPTWGPRRFVDGAVLVVTFSTRDLSLRVAMALGTVKD